MLELCDYKVPEGLEKNKMSVYITNSSPLSTYKAYLNQFQRDFTTFLKLRHEEMVSNGIMVLTFIGRNTIGNPLHRDCCHFWTLLSKSLCDLVVEVYPSQSENIYFSFECVQTRRRIFVFVMVYFFRALWVHRRWILSTCHFMTRAKKKWKRSYGKRVPLKSKI